ncbi:MAG: hypothetical protein JW995_11290 [Melioribacteraceae bacterium]|nr:hypothetical protein [Melioribacteraceae bacterium]
MLKIFPLYLLLSAVSVFASADSVTVKFTFKADSSHTVFIAGSFNNWNSTKHRLSSYDNGTWSIKINLPAGYYYYKFIDNGKWISDPRNQWKINDGGNGFNSILKAGNPPTPKRAKNKKKLYRATLPKPVLEANPEWVQLYYAAWEMAWNKLKNSTPENGFVKRYLDEGFNDLIYQWDTNFIVAFALYGRKSFPTIESLDNFYKKQRPDGYIQRVYHEKDGTIVQEPSDTDPMINPPLFAWLELKYYYMTADTSRFDDVLPVLVKYYKWIEKNCRTRIGGGLYYTTNLGSGMDNIPREGVGKAGWIDLSAQQALAAKSISEIAGINGNTKTQKLFQQKYNDLNKIMSTLCWDSTSGYYRDLKEDGSLSTTTHIGSYWTLLSETASPEQFLSLREYLINPQEYWRNHVLPALSSSDPNYSKRGHYWRGGVWAPTNYMVVKGLENYGDYQLAHSIAHNHISNISRVFENFIPDKDKIAFEERYNDGYKTIWECYSPELMEPATRWDNTFYSRQDFVGWSGLGPIAMLIENIIGLTLRADKDMIIWHINRTDRHGVSNLPFGKHYIDLICMPDDEYLSFEVSSKKEFELNIIWNDNIFRRTINPGINIFTIE